MVDKNNSFEDFLDHNPHLKDSGLLFKYYSQELINTNKAKYQWVWFYNNINDCHIVGGWSQTLGHYIIINTNTLINNMKNNILLLCSEFTIFNKF